MKESYEQLVFIKEIGRLMKDYFNCKDPQIKHEIYIDIQLLG
jgi:hypothetical protein